MRRAWRNWVAVPLLAIAFTSSSVAAPIPQVKLGVYDPTRAFGPQPSISIEHVFVSWLDFDRAGFLSLARNARSHRRELLVTIEPYMHPGETGTPSQFLTRIAQGSYWQPTNTVCAAIGSVKAPVMVRWGHEMDAPSGRYPWAGASPYSYVVAFRAFETACKRLAPNASFVWSPIASTDPNLYYPGSPFVDMIGLPVWGLQKLDSDYFGRARTFTELATEKYRLVAYRNKPIIIAEFGVSGSAVYRKGVLSGLRNTRASLPLLSAVVYFNMKEPYAWWGGYGTPDWRIEPRLFTTSP